MTPHFQLIGGWVYVRCTKCYHDFLRLGCKAVFVGCSTGHAGCRCNHRDEPEVKR